MLSSDRFLRRWSTQMPTVWACLGGMPAALSSSSVKPRPARTFVLYRFVCPRTTGRRAPATGRGNTAFALAARAVGTRDAGQGLGLKAGRHTDRPGGACRPTGRVAHLRGGGACAPAARTRCGPGPGWVEEAQGRGVVSAGDPLTPSSDAAGEPQAQAPPRRHGVRVQKGTTQDRRPAPTEEQRVVCTYVPLLPEVRVGQHVVVSNHPVSPHRPPDGA
jgi:hypothetical protein